MRPGVRRKRYRVLVHCDDRRRDAPTMWALKLLLEARGFEVLVSNRRTIRTYERWFEPHVIVLSHVQFPYSPEELRDKAKRAKLIVLPTEGALFSRSNLILSYSGASASDSAERRHAHTQYIHRVLMWGRANAEAAIEEGIYAGGQVAVVGNPRFDVYRSSYFERLRSSSTSNLCGFACSLSCLNPYDRRNPVQFFDHIRQTGPGNNFDTARSVEDYYWYMAAGLRLQLEFVYASRCQGFRLSLRPHTYEYAPSYEFLTAHIPNLELGSVWEPFYAWLGRIKVLIVVKSTSISEGFITQTPVISLQPLLRGLDRRLDFPDILLPMIKYCHVPSSLADAVEMAGQGCNGSLQPTSLKDPGVATLLREYYNWPSENFVLTDVVNHIMDVLGDTGSGDSYSHERPLTSGLALRLYQMVEYARYLREYVLSRVVDGGSHRSRFYVLQTSHFYPWNRADCLEGLNLADHLRPSLMTSGRAVRGRAFSSSDASEGSRIGREDSGK